MSSPISKEFSESLCLNEKCEANEWGVHYHLSWRNNIVICDCGTESSMIFYACGLSYHNFFNLLAIDRYKCEACKHKISIMCSVQTCIEYKIKYYCLEDRIVNLGRIKVKKFPTLGYTIEAGKLQKQAVAIALSKAVKSKKNK